MESLRHRLGALTPRERMLLALGAGALLLFLIFMLMPSAEAEPPVELAQAPPPLAAAPPADVPGPPPAAAPASSTSGLMLRGVMASGAIIAFPGGERLVPIGREALPGLTLKSVGVHHAVLASASGDLRLELGRAGATAIAGAPAAVQMASAAPADQQRETLEYRLGLQPVKAHGGISGFAVKPGASLPHLDRAGLQPGDVIVGVNGSRLDEERLMELSWQIANSSSTDFEFLRGGRRMKATLSARN